MPGALADTLINMTTLITTVPAVACGSMNCHCRYFLRYPEKFLVMGLRRRPCVSARVFCPTPHPQRNLAYLKISGDSPAILGLRLRLRFV